MDIIQVGVNIYGKVGVFMKDSLMKAQKNNMGSKYTEDWIPVSDISNGMIILDNKIKVAGIKIKPKNIFILDQASQDACILGLKNFYNMIDFEFWLIAADRPVDISGYLAKLQLLYNEVQNPVMRKMISQDMKKANEFMDNNVTDTEYYILFKDSDMNLIQKKLKTLITGLANCGLESEITSNNDLRILLDVFLNGRVQTDFRTVIS